MSFIAKPDASDARCQDLQPNARIMGRKRQKAFDDTTALRAFRNDRSGIARIEAGIISR
jgi:hypothetical protein